MTTTAHITTAEQLLAAGDIGRCELIRGELVMMSPVGPSHAVIVGRVYGRIVDFVDQHRLGVVMVGEPGFYIDRKPDTVRAPDVAFVRSARAHLVTEKFLEGPPDLAVEVNSPGDRASEVLAKVQDWLDAGCLSVWVVDPPTKTITVYAPDQKALILRRSDTIQGGDLLPGLELPLKQIFRD